MIDAWVWTWILIPILIFLARVVDVSLGTIRFIFISRGMNLLAPVIGFFEVIVWVVAIREIFSSMNNPIMYIAYAGGFATGTYVGMKIEEKLSVGIEMMRIITRTNAKKLKSVLRKAGYHITSITAKNEEGNVDVLLLKVNRKSSPKVIEIVKKYNPNAFYSLEDARFVHDTVPTQRKRNHLSLGKYRKVK